MPYLSSYKIYDATATGTTHYVPVPVHAVGDILVACLNADGSNAPALPTSTGGGTWVSVQNQANIGGQSYRLSYLVCTSAAETCTSTLASTETMAGVVCCVKGNGGTLAYDTSAARNTDDSSEPFAGIAITPGVTDTLLLQFLTSDGGIGPMLEPPFRNIAACDTGANSVGAALMYPLTTSAVGAKNWYSGAAADNTMACAITLKDDGSEDRVPAYLDPTSVVTYVWNGGSANKGGFTWDAASPHPHEALGGRDLTKVWEYDTSVYNDFTAAAANFTTADVTLTNSIGAIWYFGYDVPFENITFLVSTASNGGTVVWEYWNGTAWTTLTGSGQDLTATGARVRWWTIPTDWTAYAVSSVTKYWVRYRVSATFVTAPVLTAAWAGGNATAWVAVAAAADSHQLPYANSSSVVTAASTVLNLGGSSAAISPALDLDTGVLVVHHRAALKRDYAVDCCEATQGYDFAQVRRRLGVILALYDASNYVEGYAIHSKQSESNSGNDFNVAVIGLNNGAVPAIQCGGGTLSKSAVTGLYLISQGEFGALTFYINNILLVSSLILCGGGVGEANPITYAEFIECVNNSLMYSSVMLRSGDVCRVYVPLQLGGTDHCNIGMDGKTFIWPNQYDGQTQHEYNGNNDVLNWVMYGQDSDDSFVFTNCVFKTGQPQKWEFHSSHNANANLDFDGTTVEGFNVTLRSTVTLAGMTFKECPAFTLNSAVLSDMLFIDTKVTAASPADATDITDSTFQSSGTGHAIEIGGTAANISLDNLTFTGYAASSGSTGNEAIYVNIATGSMTISITNGGSVPSIRTAGCTVTVENSVTVKVTVKDVNTGLAIENARVLVEKVSDGTDILTGLTNSSGVVQTTYNYTADTAVIGKVRRASAAYGTLYKSSPVSSTITSSGLDITVLLIPDE